MQHNIKLHEAQWAETEMYLCTKYNHPYEAGDILTVTKGDWRDQKVFTIVKVLATDEKINQHYCILLLNPEITAHS